MLKRRRVDSQTLPKKRVRFVDINEFDFTYTINGRHYRTTGSTLNGNEFPMVLSGITRVWKVIEVDVEDQPVLDALGISRELMLKDTWLSLDSGLETEILDEIEQGLCKKYPQYFPGDNAQFIRDNHFQDLFLFPKTIESSDPILSDHCEDGKEDYAEFQLEVFSSQPESKDEGPSVDWDIELECLGTRPGSPEENLHRPTSRHPIPPRMPLQRKEYENKRHLRVVFQEAGKDLYHADDIFEAFNGVFHVCRGLFCMFSAGYVHRNINPSNIMICSGNGTTRYLLSGLEYAKAFTDNENKAIDAPKTGNPLFLPVEVAAEGYVLRAPPIQESEDLNDTRDLFDLSPNDELLPPPVTKQPVFAQHYLHDMESLFWIMVWFFFRLPALPSAQPKVEQSRVIIFPLDASSSGRLHFFTQQDNFHKHMEKMKLSEDPDSPLQKQVAVLVWKLDGIRHALLRGYRSVVEQDGFPCEHGLFVKYCNNVAAALHQTLSAAKCLRDLLKRPAGNSR